MTTVTSQLTKAFLLLFKYLPTVGKYIYLYLLAISVKVFPWEFPGREMLGQKIGIPSSYLLMCCHFAFVGDHTNLFMPLGL